MSEQSAIASPSVLSEEVFQEKGQRLFSVGTLNYTKRGLVVLFAWMLWGDFCYTLMEAIVPSILPLKLKALGGSNISMALIMSTLPSILNTTICPWVSFASDRYRSKWGRRIPFIIFTMPFLTTFLILLGFSQQIGNFIHHLAFTQTAWFSTATVTLFMIGIFMVGFQFFNMFVGSVYWYLFNDVVPKQFIGQFLGLFRVVGGLAGVFYNYFIFKYAESHMTEIFLGAALLYFFGFGLMCLRVKEGQYPPAPEYVDDQRGLFAGFKTFFVECFGLQYYWYMFGMHTFWAMASCVNMFMIFFYRDIGLSLEQYGKLAAYGGIIGMALTYPAGIVADKYHPLRVQLAMMIVLLLFGPLNLIFLVIPMSPSTAYVYCMVTGLACMPAAVLYEASEFPTFMRIYPQERFGQFCSAMSMIRAGGMILGGLIAGLIIDGLKWHYQGSDFAYRWIPAWSWCFRIFAVLCMINVYRGWKRQGGMHGYVPPLPEKVKDVNQ